MYCPDYIVFARGPIVVTLYAGMDTDWERVPRRIKLNLLRYSVSYTRHPKPPIRINKGGMWAIHVSNFLWRLRRKIRKAARDE